MNSDLPDRSRPDDGESRPEGEEDEEVDETGYKAIKDAVLFAIDVSPSMLESTSVHGDSKKSDQDSATSAALKCSYQLMQQRIISSPRDMMGILLFGTEQSKFQDDEHEAERTESGIQYPHCYLLSDLNIPEAADVKRLRSLVDDEEEAKELLRPSKEPASMANVLFCANQIFTTRAPNFSSRRLFLVTDNDNPHADSKDLRSSAIVRARDLYDLGVTIELFPISRTGEEFDRTKFYDDIVYRTDSSNPASDPDAPAPVAKAAKTASSGDGISLLQSLLSEITTRNPHKRSQFSNLPLELSPTLKISVKGYIIFKRQQKQRSCYIWLEGETPKIAIGSTSRISDDTSRDVSKAEIQKAFKFGGENVTFTAEELSKIRNLGDPAIRLIGFKDLEMLPIWANFRPSTFLYPSEEDFVGSTRVFAALRSSLLRKQKFGLVWYIPRRNAVPTLAALVAGEEKRNEENEQTFPGGLWITPLPFADDVRLPPSLAPHPVSLPLSDHERSEAEEENKKLNPPDELKDKIRDIVQQLQLPKAVYDPARYPNPSLQWHYRVLQAMALEEDMPEKPEDKTVPKYRQIHKRTGAYALEWGELLEKAYGEYQARRSTSSNTFSGSKTKKRAGSQSTNSEEPRAKTVKKEKDANGPPDITMKEMKYRYEQGTVKQLTVDVLKRWLRENGNGKEGHLTGLKKGELVERVEQVFEGI